MANELIRHLLSVIIITAFLILVFIISLFQLVASEPFSITKAFSKENIIETSMMIGVSTLVAIAIEILRTKDQSRN